MTQAEWYASLDWRGGLPPMMPRQDFPAGVVVRTREGDAVIVGHVNQSWGTCECCGTLGEDHIVAWAPIPGFPYEGHDLDPADVARARDWKARGIT